MADLDEAIEVGREAARTTSSDHPDHAWMLSNLAGSLLRKAEITRSSAAAEEAGDAIGTALARTPADHPYRAPMLTVAAGAAHVRYELTRSSDDLDAAIDGGRCVLDMLPADHPHNVGVRLNLAGALADRYRQTGRVEDRTEALHRWREATTVATAPSGMRLTAARRFVDFAASVGDWGVACDGAERLLQLLPDVAWRGLGRPSREARLTGAADLVADAVAAALQRRDPVAAARFTEQGRSLLWAQTLQLRGDLDAVATVDPALAARLAEVRRQLDVPG